MLFIDNKYTKWYFGIINHAKNTTAIGYVERHHIVPKSLGGSNEKENIVALGPREHFICHLLLRKMTTGIAKQKMSCAAHFMSKMKNGGKTGDRRYKVNSRLYAQLSIEQANYARELQRNRTLSDETKIKISRAGKGVKHSAEWVKNQIEARIRNGNTKHSEATKMKLKQAAKDRHVITVSCLKCKNYMDFGNYIKSHGEMCGIYSGPAWNTGKTMTTKGSVLEKTECKHCGKLADNGNLARWHNDNCKHRNNVIR